MNLLQACLPSHPGHVLSAVLLQRALHSAWHGLRVCQAGTATQDRVRRGPEAGGVCVGVGGDAFSGFGRLAEKGKKWGNGTRGPEESLGLIPNGKQVLPLAPAPGI